VDHKNNVVTFDARVTIVDTLSPQIFCSAGGAAVTCGVASDRKGFNCKDATIACPTQHLECDDLSNYLELAKAEDFGAVAVDISDDVSCTGTACSVVRTTDVTPTYEFDKELGVITVTYSATDNAENKGTSSRQITIWDNSPPLITVYNSGKVSGLQVKYLILINAYTDLYLRSLHFEPNHQFYYNSMAYNQLYCGYDSAEYFLELWSRGFKVGKSCVYDTVVEGKGLEAGDYKEPVVDGAVSDDELPANCHVTYRYHAVPDGSDDQWMPADDKCGASDYGGVVISFEEMVQLFKQWCVTLASGDRLCNKFTQSGGDNHAGQEKYNYQTFSMEYTCTSVSGYTASACRIVENQDNENLICHPPTPSPTPAPTTSPTSGYVILVDLTTVNTTSADEIRTGMIDACSLLSADDVLHVGTTPHDLTDLLEDVGEDRRLLEASTFKVNRDVGYAKHSYKVLSTREELILLYEQLKNWFEMMGCSEYDSEGADKAGFCLVYYEISDPITPPDDPPLPTPQPTAYPTTAPTPQPCDDGSHGCDEEDNGGICHMAPGLTNGWTCACDVGYECVSNCDAPYSGHTCDATPAPTAFPTAMPTNFPTTSPTSHPTVCSHFHLDDEGDNFDISCEISDGQGGTKWSDDHRFCAIPETQDDGSCGFRCSCDETHGTDLCYTLGTNFENKWNQSACWLPRPPALVIDGGGIIHEDATHDETKKFNDPGATCTDDLLHCKHPSDCDLPVRISGDQVDLTVVGTYWVHYHCISPAGFNATLPRQVVVEDKTCPKCAYEKKNAKDKSDPASITVEASFPYMPGDYRPTCEDECGFSADPKCAKHSVPASIISNDVDVEKTGKYHVEFNAADHHGNRCHESRVILTVTVVDTMRPIIGLQIHPNEPPHSPSTGGVSSATFKTHKGEENPARTHFQFMANAGTSSGRSSSLAAAAVAVIGVALLAVAARTIGPPIAVPV
jgi:hypothetical protein